jgi:hypothetical protein
MSYIVCLTFEFVKVKSSKTRFSGHFERDFRVKNGEPEYSLRSSQTFNQT